MRSVAPGTIAEQQAKSNVSNRCFLEYEIGLDGAELKLYTHVLFKKVLKVGTKFILVVESMGNVVPEYSLEILQVSAMTYIPKQARYIDSVLISGDKAVHFFAQPKGATTGEMRVNELAIREVRRPHAPAREEDKIKHNPRNIPRT